MSAITKIKSNVVKALIGLGLIKKTPIKEKTASEYSLGGISLETDIAEIPDLYKQYEDLILKANEPEDNGNVERFIDGFTNDKKHYLMFVAYLKNYKEISYKVIEIRYKVEPGFEADNIDLICKDIAAKYDMRPYESTRVKDGDVVFSFLKCYTLCGYKTEEKVVKSKKICINKIYLTYKIDQSVLEEMSEQVLRRKRTFTYSFYLPPKIMAELKDAAKKKSAHHFDEGFAMEYITKKYEGNEKNEHHN